jgi:hypothetical protein
LLHPIDVLGHLARGARLSYPLRVLVPFGLLPLAAPRLLLPVAPILAINLMSDFPTTTSLESHYLTPALPWLAAAAVSGLGRLRARFPPRSLWRAGLIVVPCLALAVSHRVAGGTPIARAFDASAFEPDARTRAARRALTAIPDGVSVQAPAPLLPHLAERPRVHLAPPPERGTAFVVLDVSHRERYAHTETLLRTSEEPLLRAWLARDDHALITAESPYFVFERGASPRNGLGAGAILATDVPPPNDAIALTRCLALVSATLGPDDHLDLIFHARSVCPADLAIRLGASSRPRRVDLLFDGLLSPAHLRAGDRVLSEHRVSGLDEALHVGLLRSSGARPEHGDPVSVRVALAHSFGTRSIPHTGH